MISSLIKLLLKLKSISLEQRDKEKKDKEKNVR